jgi:DNA-binding response OmpR family regulator
MPESEGAPPVAAKRVLVVDDDDDVSSTLADMLRTAGYAVKTTYSGRQALAFMETDKFDAVILDLAMPGKGGISVLHDLKERGDTTPVVVLSAYLGMLDREQLSELGAREVLEKPAGAEELVSILAALTGS